MTPRSCPHEADVLDLVAIEQWPQRADAALRAHVAECEMCAELASIATAVREWGASVAVPKTPDAAVVWRRAQVKARSEAARSASKPLWVAQGFALVALVIALVWVGPSASWYASVWQSVSGAAPSSAWPSLRTFPEGWGWSVLFVLAGVAVLFSLVIAALRLTERAELSNNR